MPSRSLTLTLAAAAVTLAACTSSGGSSGSSGSSGAVSPASPAPATTSTAASTPPPGRWTKQVAGQQLTALLYTYQKKAQTAAVDPSAPFDQLHTSLQALSQACSELVGGVRSGAWPAEVRAKAKAFADVQDEECRVDAKFAAATTPDEYRAVTRLPADHSQKIFDARLALENALGL